VLQLFWKVFGKLSVETQNRAWLGETDPQLVKVFWVKLPLLNLAGIRENLRKGIAEHRHERLLGRTLGGQMEGPCPEGPDGSFTDCEAISAIAFTARIQQQPEFFHPSVRHLQKRCGRALHELKLDFTNPQGFLARGDFTLIESDFNQRPVLTQPALGTLDFNGEAFHEASVPCSGEDFFENGPASLPSWRLGSRTGCPGPPRGTLCSRRFIALPPRALSVWVQTFWPVGPVPRNRIESPAWARCSCWVST
jgi:hypothetical protein